METRLFHFSSDSRERPGVAGHQGDMRALFGEGNGCPESNARRCPGDECAAMVEPEGWGAGEGHGLNFSFGWTKFSLVNKGRIMRQVNIHEAKTHLSRLVEEAAKGDGFIIAKAGKPMVRVVSIEAAPVDVSKRIGFAEGKYTIPDDFDSMFADEIAEMFGTNT